MRLPSQALSADEKLLLFVFNGYEGPNSRGIFPGLERLARQCARSVNHVRKVIRGLASKGVVSILERKTAHGDHDTNLYTIHIEALLALLGAELWASSCFVSVARPSPVRCAAGQPVACEQGSLAPVEAVPVPVEQPLQAPGREVLAALAAPAASPEAPPVAQPVHVRGRVERPESAPAASAGGLPEREWRSRTEQLWQQAWRRSYSADYTLAREDQGRFAFLARTALEKAQKRSDELTSQGAAPEPLLDLASAYLRHLFGAYLLNPGSQRRPDEPGFLRERRHPLRLLVDELHVYRDPWFKQAADARRAPIDAPGQPVREAAGMARHSEELSGGQRQLGTERAHRVPVETPPANRPSSAPTAQVVPLGRPTPTASSVSSVIPAMVAAAAMAVVLPGASVAGPAPVPDVLATASPSTPPEFSSSLDALVARTAGAMALESAGPPRRADEAEVCSLDELRRRMPGVPDDELVMLLQAEKRRLRMLEATWKGSGTPGESPGKKV